MSHFNCLDEQMQTFCLFKWQELSEQQAETAVYHRHRVRNQRVSEYFLKKERNNTISAEKDFFYLLQQVGMETGHS